MSVPPITPDIIGTMTAQVGGTGRVYGGYVTTSPPMEIRTDVGSVKVSIKTRISGKNNIMKPATNLVIRKYIWFIFRMPKPKTSILHLSFALSALTNLIFNCESRLINGTEKRITLGFELSFVLLPRKPMCYWVEFRKPQFLLIDQDESQFLVSLHPRFLDFEG